MLVFCNKILVVGLIFLDEILKLLLDKVLYLNIKLRSRRWLIGFIGDLIAERLVCAVLEYLFLLCRKALALGISGGKNLKFTSGIWHLLSLIQNTSFLLQIFQILC